MQDDLRRQLSLSLKQLSDSFRESGIGFESSQITRPQLQLAIASLAINASKASISELFSSLDPHSTGTIDLADLTRELRAHRPIKMGVRALLEASSSTSTHQYARLPAGANMNAHETEAQAFALIDEGRLVEALSMLEIAMAHHRHQLGVGSPEMLRCTRAAADVCNSIAMQVPAHMN